MSDFNATACSMCGPGPGTASATDTRPPQRISGTGTTEGTATHGLAVGRMATLLVGNTAVRFRLASAAALATQVATTDPVLGANARYDWLVESDTRFPYIEAGDGVAAFEAWVWTSSVTGV